MWNKFENWVSKYIEWKISQSIIFEKVWENLKGAMFLVIILVALFSEAPIIAGLILLISISALALFLLVNIIIDHVKVIKIEWDNSDTYK